MDPRHSNNLGLVIGVSAAVLLGCVATWIVMDMRIRREREAMREEIRNEVRQITKDGIKGAADDLLTREYVEKKVTDEANKLLKDPPIEAVSKTAEAAADTGVKLGAKTATGVLGAVKDNEKEIRDTGKAAGEAARIGIDVLLEATRAALGAGEPKDDPKTPPEEEK